MKKIFIILFSLLMFCVGIMQASANELTTLANSLASSGITEVTNIAGGSTGDIAIFFWAFALFIAILALLFYLFKGKGKG